MILPEPRFRERVPCRVSVEGDSDTYGGTVLNLSWSGLFVETAGCADPGSQVWLELTPQSQRPYLPSIRVATRVVWKSVEEAPRPQDPSSGVGLRIQDASESYYDFLLGVAASPYADPVGPGSGKP